MQEKNIEWISNLRAISTLSVVILHVSAFYAGEYHINPNDRSWWIIGNIMDGLVRFSVPAFIMISGFLWLNSHDSLRDFYRKKALRLVGPFLFWSLAYYFFNMFYLKTQSSDVHIFEDFFRQFQANALSSHLWYVYMLMGLFFIAPVFSGWVKQAGRKDILVFLIVWVVVLLYGDPFFSPFRLGIDLHLMAGYTGYLLFGYYLATYSSGDPKIVKRMGLGLFLAGAAFTILATQFLSASEDRFNPKFYDYLTLNVLVSSIGIFLWFRHTRVRGGIIIGIRDSVSKYGYGIYLCHVMVMCLFTKHWYSIDFHPLIYIPALTLVTFSISWGAIYLLNRLPYGRYFAG